MLPRLCLMRSVKSVTYIYINYYLLPDIPELLPLDTVQVGEHVQHQGVVAVVGGEAAAMDLTVAHILISYKVSPLSTNQLWSSVDSVPAHINIVSGTPATLDTGEH